MPTYRVYYLDAAGVKTSDRGEVEIDEFQRTSNPKVYAIGDLVRGKALAHLGRATEWDEFRVPLHVGDEVEHFGRGMLDPPRGGELRHQSMIPNSGCRCSEKIMLHQ